MSFSVQTPFRTRSLRKFITNSCPRLHGSLEDNCWDVALNKIHPSWNCAHLKLVQFKQLQLDCHKFILISQTAVTNVMLHPAILPMFSKLAIIILLLAELHQYYVTDVFDNYKAPSPHCHLRVYQWNQCTSKQLCILAFTSLLARRHLLLLHWKSAKAPFSPQRLGGIMCSLKLEKIIFSGRANSDPFYNKLQSFLTFFNSLQSLSPDWWSDILFSSHAPYFLTKSAAI